MHRLSRGVVVCVLLAAPFTTACGRWAPESDYATQSQLDAEHAYQKLLKVFADKQYHVVEQRDAEHYAKVRAHIDENFVAHQSFIAAQVDAQGVVHFTPSGHLVRGGTVHKRLQSELLELESAMRGDAGPEPSASASAAPAPLPATESASTASTSPPPVVTPPPAPAPTAKATSKPKAATAPAPKATAAAKPAPAPKSTAKPSGDDWVPVQ